MASKTLRKRLHHGDVDGRRGEPLETSGLGGLVEPLLGNYELEDDLSGGDHFGDHRPDERIRQHLHWMFLFSQLIAQWAQWIENVVSSLLGRVFPFSSSNCGGQSKHHLSPLQEERLGVLQKRLEVPVDGSKVEHQNALKHLWKLSFPNRKVPSLKSELWKEMGWQGSDPSTDFRGGGFISLENLIFFAERYPRSFRSLLLKEDGDRADWEYPFAIAGINISFMLIQMLGLQSEKPSSIAQGRFIELAGNDEAAFDELYCIAFQLLDAQWLAKRASYMQFNDVLKCTRLQLEQELSLEGVSCVQDLPAYTLLKT